MAKKAQEKTEKVRIGLLKIKVKGQGVKTWAENKKKIKLKEREELLNRRIKWPSPLCEEFEKEIDELSPFEG